MPPVKPNRAFVNGHLYQLFRREFVSSYPSPLCSDAYSGFVIHDPQMVAFDFAIPSFAAFISYFFF